jgi:S-adenosylmethionine-diacylglycerol 3-amino-3-carboxypropyl transferase
MCWEDPAVDARALDIRSSDHVLTITSAGCNALHLLLLGPGNLTCIDSNPAQNALFELKLAAIRCLDWPTFWRIFAAESPAILRTVYGRLRPSLSPIAAAYWDRHIKLVESGLYRSGRMGAFFRLIRFYLHLRGLTKSDLAMFFSLTTLDQQRRWYSEHLAPTLWSPLGARIARSRSLLYLSGVHPKQLDRLVADDDPYEAARRCFEHALTELPVRSNYFWQMAVMGSFREDSFPQYLDRGSFDLLRQGLGRVVVVYGWLDDYLDRIDPASIDKLNLRDVMDWMNDVEQQLSWKRIARTMRPAARVVMRSASRAARLPSSMRCEFAEDHELSNALTFADRSATHGRVLAVSRAQTTTSYSARANGSTAQPSMENRQ